MCGRHRRQTLPREATQWGLRNGHRCRLRRSRLGPPHSFDVRSPPLAVKRQYREGKWSGGEGIGSGQSFYPEAMLARQCRQPVP